MLVGHTPRPMTQPAITTGEGCPDVVETGHRVRAVYMRFATYHFFYSLSVSLFPSREPTGALRASDALKSPGTPPLLAKETGSLY